MANEEKKNRSLKPQARTVTWRRSASRRRRTEGGVAAAGGVESGDATRGSHARRRAAISRRVEKC